MTATDKDTVEVIQADREAAANFGRGVGRITRAEAEQILGGEWDKLDELQAFARHRLASSSATGEVERLRSLAKSNNDLARLREDEASRLRAALTAEDEYWAASRAMAAALPRLRDQAQMALSAAAQRREEARAALSVSQSGWRTMESAPANQPVEIRVGHMTFVARLVPNASMTSDEETCEQWQAEYEGEHPPCWSDGACWASNEDEVCSLQPTAWRPTPPSGEGE